MSSLVVVTLAFSLAASISGSPADLTGSPIIRRDLPEPVSASTAKTYLANLTVAEESNEPPYDRDLFETWISINGTCDTRETILARDGTDIKTDTDCSVTSGKWTSPYDGVATDLASDLDIDHVVPLKEAWISGARDWTAEQRKALANDVVNPQLVAVTDNLNQEKSDQDPADWVPPLQSYVCKYIRAYVQVKHEYDLSVDEDEKSALEGYLNDC